MDNPYAAPNPAVGPVPGDEATYVPSMFELQGRIGRIRYLVYLAVVPMLAMLVAVVAYMLSSAQDHPRLLPIMLVPIGAAAVIVRRRLQDLDKPDWLVALLFVPVVSIGLHLYLLFARGHPGANRYGPAAGPNSRKLMLSAYALIALFVLWIAAMLAVYMPAATSLEQALELAQSSPLQVQDGDD